MLPLWEKTLDDLVEELGFSQNAIKTMQKMFKPNSCTIVSTCYPLMSPLVIHTHKNQKISPNNLHQCINTSLWAKSKTCMGFYV